MNPTPRARLIALDLATVAAPILLIAGVLVEPSGSGNAAFLRAIGADPTATVVGSSLIHFGMLAMIAAAFGLADRVRESAPIGAWLGSTLAAMGFATINGVVAVDYWDLALVDKLSFDQALEVSDAAGAHSGLILVFFLPLLVGCFGGLALLAVALWRAHLVPRLLLVLMPVGVLVFFFTEVAAGTATGAAMFCLAPAYLAIRDLVGARVEPAAVTG